MSICSAEVVSLVLIVGSSGIGSMLAEELTPGPADRISVPSASLEASKGSTERSNGVDRVQDFSLSLAAGPGVAAFGSVQAHDFSWATFGYGHRLANPLARDHWYAGHFEIRGEFFAGAQFSPSSEWIVGLSSHLRYNFDTGTRFVPFFDIGAGVTGTSIDAPDLSNSFEFNTQAGPGLHCFLKENLAVTFEARYIHISCAGLSQPNLGANAVLAQVGVTCFF